MRTPQSMDRRRKTMSKQKSKQSAKVSHKPFDPPYPNDWLEFAILCVVGLGVGGAMFALLYLMHEAGVI